MSFASEQIARIETLLAENPGVKSVVVGNATVTYEDLLKQYDYWKTSRIAKQAGEGALSRTQRRASGLPAMLGPNDSFTREDGSERRAQRWLSAGLGDGKARCGVSFALEKQLPLRGCS